jgi:hypothetical protein
MNEFHSGEWKHVFATERNKRLRPRQPMSSAFRQLHPQKKGVRQSELFPYSRSRSSAGKSIMQQYVKRGFEADFAQAQVA